VERNGILCGGAWCIDRNMSINHWPQEETVSTIFSERLHGGCPGHNMSVGLKKLGAPFPISAIGLIGNDEDGNQLRKICDEHGIERSELKSRAGVSTSFTLVMNAKDTGKRTFFHSPGAHALQTPDDFDFKNSSARIVHLGLPGLHEKLDSAWKEDASGWVAILKKARAIGLKPNIELVSVEPEKIRAAALPLLDHLDTLIINDYEAGALAGIETIKNGATDAHECRMAAETLMERSKLSLCAIHFPMGGIVLSRNGNIAEHASVKIPKSEVVGSSGAGDAFAAGILFGHHENWLPMQSLKLAHASAAASMRHESTTGSMVNWKECLGLADAWGWRG
jgi:sugar/nucleoside kinase (ribokinase family)